MHLKHRKTAGEGATGERDRESTMADRPAIWGITAHPRRTPLGQSVDIAGG